MLGWFRKRTLPAPEAEPLRGAPPHPRMKAYSAATGYVYQYYFAGQRPAQRQLRSGIEYVFYVSKDRKTEAAVTVFIEDEIFEEWMLERSQDLSGSHRYAVAKLALRNAFDERPPEQAFAEVRPSAMEVAEILEQLEV